MSGEEGAAGGRAPSLDVELLIGGRDHCPRKPLDLVAIGRPELRFPASCDAYGCTVCGVRKAEQSAALLTWALRRASEEGYRCRFVTLTLAPEDWQARRQKVRDLGRWARSEGFDWEIAWATELGKRTGMRHVHGLQWGRQKLPQARVQERWGAHVDVRAVRGLRDGSGAPAYTVKGALRVAGYALKGSEGSHDQLTAHRDLNGGRVVHWSRGFLHGETRRGALRELRRELAGGEDLTWLLVPAGAPAPDSRPAGLDRPLEYALTAHGLA